MPAPERSTLARFQTPTARMSQLPPCITPTAGPAADSRPTPPCRVLCSLGATVQPLAFKSICPAGNVGATAATPAVSESTPLEELPTPEAVAPLFKPVKVGLYELKTRAVYAPLTRSRAIDTVPVPEAAEYYAQRTNPGQLIIAEATGVSDATKGYGYPNTPGIHTPEQMEGWKPVVKAVHDQGGIFFCQLWHTGRASHPAYHGAQPVSSSDVPITDDQVILPDTGEKAPYPVPRPLETDEVPQYVDLFRTAARHAIDVGFDGVEIHATNGYLIAQFLENGINKRTDKYGGSIENRCRFCLEIVKAVTEEVGSDRVGIRVGPYTGFLSTSDTDPQALYTHLVEELNKFNLAYMHFIEARVKGSVLKDEEVTESIEPIVKRCKTKVILAGGFIDESGENNRGPEAIANGEADLVAYGRWALANPDLLKRFKLGAPLNRFDKSTFYTPGNKGYIDYPFLEETDYGKNFVKAES